MTTHRESRLQAMGYALDKISAPKAKYASLKRAGNLLFSAGSLPTDGENLIGIGKLPMALPVEKAAQMAALCMANILRSVHRQFGSLDVIEQAVKVTGFVNSAPDFPDQHLVLNGASEVLLHVLGEQGIHSRSAVGVAMLPLNACVEVEAVFELVKGI